MNDKVGLKDNHVGNHRMVDSVRILGDVEVFLDDTANVGKERPVAPHCAAMLVRLSDTVDADGDQPAIVNLKFTMKRTRPSAWRRFLGQYSPPQRTRITGCCPCSSESFRRFAVWSESS